MKLKRRLALTLALALILGLLAPGGLVKVSAEEGSEETGEMPFVLSSETALQEGTDFSWVVDGNTYTLSITSEKAITVKPNAAFNSADAIAKIVIDQPRTNVTIDGCSFQNGGMARKESGSAVKKEAYISVTANATLTIKDTSFTNGEGLSIRALRIHGAECILTLEDVTSNCNIYCDGSSKVTMTVAGENNIKVTEESSVFTLNSWEYWAYFSALTIDSDASLTIKGGGTLNLEATGATALGGGSSNSGCSAEIMDMGELVIEDAIVNAISKTGEVTSGMGIGGGVRDKIIDSDTGRLYDYIVIQGGTVDASSDMLPNIGQWNDGGIIITGGSVKATGIATIEEIDEHKKAMEDEDEDYISKLTGKLGDRPINDGELLFLCVVEGLAESTLVTALTLANDYAYGIDNMYTDKDGKVYLWLPESLAGTEGTITVGGKETTFTIPADNKLLDPVLDTHYTFNSEQELGFDEWDLISMLGDYTGLGEPWFTFYTDDSYETEFESWRYDFTIGGSYYVMASFAEGVNFTAAENVELGELTITKKTPKLGRDFYYDNSHNLNGFSEESVIGISDSEPAFPTLTYYADEFYEILLGEAPRYSGVFYVKAAFVETDTFKAAEIELGKLYLLSNDDSVHITLDEGSTKYLYILSEGYIRSGKAIANPTDEHKLFVPFWGQYVLSTEKECEAFVIVVENARDITLDGLKLDVSSKTGSCAFSVQEYASATLLLKGENSLKSGANMAGLNVQEEGTVAIDVPWGKGDAYGSLLAISGGKGAGIGGNAKETTGTIYIYGGTITAYSGASGSCTGAGIGAGEGGFDSGLVCIMGGIVNAYSSLSGTGAASGIVANTVEFGGGTTYALSSLSGTGGAAGISGSDVVISGGSIVSKQSAGSDIFISSPVDSDNTLVYLVTLSLDDINAVTAITGTNRNDYGVDSVYTDAEGKVYFWLPKTPGSDDELPFSSLSIGTGADSVEYSSKIPVKADKPNATTLYIDSTKIPLEVTVEKEDLKYKDKWVEPSADAEVDEEKPDCSHSFEYFYAGRDGTVYEETYAPSTPGKYTVTAKLICGSGDHQGIGSADFEITKIALSWASDGVTSNKEYDGTTKAYISKMPTLNTSNLINNDSVGSTSVLVGDLNFASASAGTGIAVTATNWGLKGELGDCYSVPQPTFSPANITDTKVPVTNSGGTATVTHAGGTFDLSDISGLFTIDKNAGAATYTLETSGSPTGTGSIGTDGKTLTVTKAGTFTIGLTTAATKTHRVGDMVTATLTVETDADPGGNTDNPGSGSGSSAPSQSVPDSNVFIDGKPVDAGTTTIDRDKGSATTEINQTTFEKQLENGNRTVQIILPDTAENADISSVTAQLVVKNIADMAEKGMTLSVVCGGISYDLPTTAVDTAAILAELGIDDPSLAPVSITITPIVSNAVLAAVEAVVGEEYIVIPPMQFEVTATYDGKTVRVSGFSNYVPRTIEVSAAQAAKITTAVIVDESGNSYPVPTNVYQKGGKWYAEINSLTNSTYVLIFNEASFPDIAGAWYEKYVQEAGDRKMITGYPDGSFTGDASITRAEFVQILVGALGLSKDGDGTVFGDVKATDWYAGAIGKAHEYGLVSGKGNGIFDPQANITRQEAMIMIRNAAKIADYSGQSGSLEHFSDAAEVAGWAQDAVKFCVGSGLVTGYDGKVMPEDSITRAETAAIVLRLLQEAGLVDKRS